MRVCDMEGLLSLVRSSKEEQESKAIYGYLFEFFRKNLLKPKLPPLVGDGLTPPPFEKPSIAQVRGHMYVAYDEMNPKTVAYEFGTAYCTYSTLNDQSVLSMYTAGVELDATTPSPPLS